MATAQHEHGGAELANSSSYVKGSTMDEKSTEQTYSTPAINELGTVVEVTLGSAGSNNPDDTQYWE
ncbi:lasso RiPP family leader peptide-containing protein [Streptomyces sp. NPDC048567]|uniref:lasso RiPP family leader peptide-containing protein n=1 Tax=Streptomyces sp. NPDC048567 TaxID=3365570 RepID=UPI00371B05A1